MPFPFSSNGLIVCKTSELPRAIAAVEELLQRAKASSVSTAGTRIDFTAGLFRFVTNWNLLGPIGSGNITFRQSDGAVEIRYHISFVQLFVVMTLMVIFMFGLLPGVLLGSRSSVPPSGLGLMWLWLFGGNYLITIFRFPAALRNALNNAPARFHQL